MNNIQYFILMLVQSVPCTRNKRQNEGSIPALYLDISLNMYINDKLTTQLYDIAILQLLPNPIITYVHGIYISQPIRYVRACSASEQFLNRDKVSTTVKAQR